MDWNRVQGNWKQVEGKVKAKWGKLTDDDLTVINGRREQLEGKIQERYGLAKDQPGRKLTIGLRRKAFKSKALKMLLGPGPCAGLSFLE